MMPHKRDGEAEGASNLPEVSQLASKQLSSAINLGFCNSLRTQAPLVTPICRC